MTEKQEVKIKRLYETRFSFGATAAIITSLGLIIGLRTGAHAKFSIIASIMVIALADNISDSFGIHIYQESEGLSPREVWFSTATNFLTRILVSSLFVFLVAFLPLNIAVISSIILGLLLLASMSFIISKDRGTNPYPTVIEHLSVAVLVIVASNYLGKLILSKVHFP